jgi:hypothetical protein
MGCAGICGEAIEFPDKGNIAESEKTAIKTKAASGVC